MALPKSLQKHAFHAPSKEDEDVSSSCAKGVQDGCVSVELVVPLICADMATPPSALSPLEEMGSRHLQTTTIGLDEDSYCSLKDPLPLRNFPVLSRVSRSGAGSEVTKRPLPGHGLSADPLLGTSSGGHITPLGLMSSLTTSNTPTFYDQPLPNRDCIQTTAKYRTQAQSGFL
ncbi:hypothetical protein BIW11_12614 [Tropilaelaps mercedesae]|uniref:Uncharacterized protein n=1 Tax=Tropilaelaps mercedesae TaxID=418985 RepID=A0A1V9X6I7_9ACAR|nr:hypothetical protein BIW11_12614 [Tropilaelaps mercedesae]